MKTNQEYAAHESVIGLTGAAKKSAIKLLYDADKALEIVAPRAKLPSNKELANQAAIYSKSLHSILIAKETDKAIAIEISVDFCDVEKHQNCLVWLPKSTLVNGQAYGWMLDEKLDEVIRSARSARLGSVFASYTK